MINAQKEFLKVTGEMKKILEKKDKTSTDYETLLKLADKLDVLSDEMYTV